MAVVFEYNWENLKRVGKRLQVCRLAMSESPTCTCELFIRKCGADNLKDDTDTFIMSGEIEKDIQIR